VGQQWDVPPFFSRKVYLLTHIADTGALGFPRRTPSRRQRKGNQVRNPEGGLPRNSANSHGADDDQASAATKDRQRGGGHVTGCVDIAWQTADDQLRRSDERWAQRPVARPQARAWGDCAILLCPPETDGAPARPQSPILPYQPILVAMPYERLPDDEKRTIRAIAIGMYAPEERPREDGRRSALFALASDPREWVGLVTFACPIDGGGQPGASPRLVATVVHPGYRGLHLGKAVSLMCGSLLAEALIAHNTAAGRRGEAALAVTPSWGPAEGGLTKAFAHGMRTADAVPQVTPAEDAVRSDGPDHAAA
jgi:GNAT superfamily N-acetyltransferase